MKAIRPIYDGKDDLDYRTGIDDVDMMVCLFSEINESIDSNGDITEDDRRGLRDHVELEILCGTEFNKLIVTYEIARWMQESGYGWDAVIPKRYQYIGASLGMKSVSSDISKESELRGEFLVHVESRAFRELQLLLPLHWATSLLGWQLVEDSGTNEYRMLEFGGIYIMMEGDDENREL